MPQRPFAGLPLFFRSPASMTRLQLRGGSLSRMPIASMSGCSFRRPSARRAGPRPKQSDRIHLIEQASGLADKVRGGYAKHGEGAAERHVGKSRQLTGALGDKAAVGAVDQKYPAGSRCPLQKAFELVRLDLRHSRLSLGERRRKIRADQLSHFP